MAGVDDIPASAELPAIGSRVLVVSVTWGEGTVVAYNPGETAKQLTVKRDDGAIGHFYVSQVVPV